MIKFNSLLILFSLVTLSSNVWGQCQGLDLVNLGVDTTICTYDELILSGPQGYDFYQWSEPINNDSLTVTQAGTYSLMAGNYGNVNLVQHGDFQGGTTNTDNNFTSDYIPGQGGGWGILSNGGQYAISTDPSLTHSNFVVCGDHTTGTGNMLVANGSHTPNTTVWRQTVTVTPNTGYLFSFWATNVVNNPAVSYLQLYINNVPIGDTNVTSTACNWSEIGSLWNSGTATSAILEIKNHSTAASGNDFAIDDIFFGEVCYSLDSIIVTEDNITVDAGPDLFFCENEPEQLVATSNDPNAAFEWNTTETTSTITPTVDGLYTVSATSNLGCRVSDSALVGITEMDWDIDSIFIQNTNCEATDGYVGVILDNPNNLNANYLWYGPGQNTSNFINASVFSSLGVGWYFLEVSYDGCTRTDSAYVDINNAPVASFTATPAMGFAPQSVTFTNNSSNTNSFIWDLGNGVTTFDETPADQVYEEGVYEVMLIAGDGACTDTAYQTIIVQTQVILPGGVVEVPNVFTPNGDNQNDAFYFDVMNVNPENFEVVIFNRWGEQVFSSNDPDFKWDGKINGNPASEGTYFYIYKGAGLDGTELEGQGFVQLVRN